MRRKTKILNVLMVLFIVTIATTALIAMVSAQAISINQNETKVDTVELQPSGKTFQVDVVGEFNRELNEKAAVYLVRLSDSPLATYSGGIKGLAATSLSATGDAQLNAKSPSAIAYRDYLLGKQAETLAAIERVIDRQVDVRFQYFAANNGFAAWLTPAEADLVAEMDGVTFVQRDFERELQTDAGPAWIGAPGLWDGSNTGGLPGTMGEGMIVGIIDTGINPSNPSFADIGGDGYDHTNPRGSGVYVGVCDSTNITPTGNIDTYDPTFPCNDKLIGAWGYTDVYTSAWDYDGHGSHTASTTAGNIITITVSGPTVSISSTISGVAPHANIIAYQACCTLSALTAAIDQAVVDKVDAINYSIGSTSPSNVWNDFDTVGYLNARAAGIFVATAAGNAGPGPDTVGSPADAPWLTSVGATTHNRKFINVLMNITSDISSTANITGVGFTAGYGPAPIVYAGWFTNTNDPGGDPAQCLQPFPAGTFSGEIVVCDRGAIARTAKGANVLAGGAGGFVLANTPAQGESIVGDAHLLPGVHIGATDAAVLRAWLNANKNNNPVATISGSVPPDTSAKNADIMAGFSSRGQNRALPGIVVPSISAPGVDILAAYGTDNAVEWDMISGTSMASPHIAGSGTLMMALHPNWSPAEVQSALMLTAWTDVRDSDGSSPADPFDMGNGRVDLNVASKTGLVMDEAIANYTAANPAVGGDPKTLNLPSMGNAQCLASCSWTRVVSSTQPVTVTWTAVVTANVNLTLTVSPAKFDVGPYGTQMITVTADVSALPADTWAFSEVRLTPSDPNLPDAHMPVAVNPTKGVLPSLLTVETRRNDGSHLIADVQTIEVTDLTVNNYGLAKATITPETLTEDPTNGDPFDNLNDGTTFFITTTVASGDKRLVAEVLESEAPDLDLYVGLDTGDGVPQATETVCTSASGTALEYCDVTDPAAGTYWILVQNWEGTGGPGDDLTLATAVVPDSKSGNMDVTGPSTAAKGSFYDLRLFFNLGSAQPGDVYYGAFALGSDAGNPGNIGTVPVNLYRLEDDVSKVANYTQATPGLTVTYGIDVLPNVGNETFNYTITDTFPVSMTYVAGSASANMGTVSASGAMLTWTVRMLPPGPGLDEDPTVGFGFLPLANFGVSPAPCSSVCDETILNVSGMDFFYDGQHYDSIQMISNGFIVPGGGASDPLWNPQNMPDPTVPNNVIAPFWTDLDMDGTSPTDTGGGIWYLGGLTAGSDTFTVMEWSNAEQWGDPSSFYSFQIWIQDGTDNIWFTYGGFTGDTSTAAVGVENGDGSLGHSYYYNTAGTLPLTTTTLLVNSFRPGDPANLSYQLVPDNSAEGTMQTNNVDHAVDNPGSQTESTSFSVQIIDAFRRYLPVIFKN